MRKGSKQGDRREEIEGRGGRERAQLGSVRRKKKERAE